ncbi:MAG: GntR family transcriptional regulator [Syntrophales bacterium]
MKMLLPLYYQIKHTIRNWISNKEISPGEKIPSTYQLADRFKVNHLTVRQAIEELVQEGFLISKRGLGTFVSENENLIHSLSIEITGFMDEIFYEIQKAKTVSVVIDEIPATPVVRESLALPPEEKTVIRIKRVRLLREKSFNFAVNYLPIDIGSKIIEADLHKKPLLQILEQDLNIEFTDSYQTIQASFADQEISDQLNVPPGSPILYIERIIYTKKNKPVEILHASYRGDLFKYVVRLKNVRKKNGNFWVHHGG